MYHSITIGDKNTWRDWHLIPASRPVVNPPPVKTNMIEIPGADGTLDLTESLAGRAVFGDRTGSWTFYVDNDHATWSSIYSSIMGYLHGKQLTCYLEDDPSFYYEGRFSVNQWLSESWNSKIVINYEVGPYKLYSLDTGDRWLWDTFNFRTGVIRSFRNMAVRYGKTLTVDVIGDTMEVIPTITANFPSGTYIELLTTSGTYKLKKGHNVFDDVVIREGLNPLRFYLVVTGSSVPTSNLKGTITLKLIGGRL